MKYVELKLGKSYSQDLYGSVVESFRRIDAFPENSDVVTEGFEATVSPLSWNDISSSRPPEEMTAKDIEKETKYLVVAQRYATDRNDEDTVYLEFSDDNYGKFVYVSKLDPRGLGFSTT